MIRPTPTDVVLLAVEWQSRALTRAQLIEEGLEVVATDNWSMMRRHLRPGIKPKLALVDLKGLNDPERVLTDLRALMKPDQVLVLTAAGTVSPDDVHRFGFRTLSRPIAIEQVVRTAADMLHRSAVR